MSAIQELVVEVRAEVLQAVRHHARSSMNAEVCGVWLGTLKEGVTQVEARIQGEGAAQGGAHVTFTHDTWEHIYRVKDEKFPGLTIVGWYHSHPGFGVFLSEYDLFIHRNFFSNLGQVAWVFDPHTDEEGCFVWAGGDILRVSSISVKDERTAFASAKIHKSEGKPLDGPAGGGVAAPPRERGGAMLSGRIGMIGLGILLGFALGFIVGFYFKERRPWRRGVPARVLAVDPEIGGAILGRSNAVNGGAVNDSVIPPKVKNSNDVGRANSATSQNLAGTNMSARQLGGKRP